MKLSDNHLKQLRALATEAARRAGEFIQSIAGEHVDVQAKEGGSSHASQVVTEVDFESQRLILDTLKASMDAFDLGLLTEELQDDSSRHEHDYFWCIDPLDGTLPFTEHVAGYSVSIALVSREGEAVIGVIQDPVADNLYQAMRGGGSFRNHAPFVPQNRSNALTLVMDRSFQQQKIYGTLLAGVECLAAEHGLAGVKIINQGGAAMNACWVIENSPAVYLKLPKLSAGGGSLWDYAASAIIFKEAGAVATDVVGKPLKLNRADGTFMNPDGIVYASSTALADAIYGLCRAATDSS